MYVCMYVYRYLQYVGYVTKGFDHWKTHSNKWISGQLPSQLIHTDFVYNFICQDLSNLSLKLMKPMWLSSLFDAAVSHQCRQTMLEVHK